MPSNKKILLTGGAGFLGKFVVQELIKQGYKKENIFIPRSKQLDLRKLENCQKAVRGRDIVIHLAGNVGGIGYNREKPGELFYDNLMMGVQLMETARQAGVEKFVAVGTVCAYPKNTPAPFKEKDLWIGYPEETNAPYGLAKKMLLVQAVAYRQQYDFNAIYLLPVNLYGPGDNFSTNSSHVIPALIRKVREAKENQSKFIEVWGSGQASREFLYVEDAARSIVLATKKYNSSLPVNIGSGQEIKISQLVKLICKLMGYRGEIRWDKTKPDGQLRRRLDVSRAKAEFNFQARHSLETGLRKTIAWFKQNHLI
ncbi:MAG: GDP-fucose synthetase [Candidatus Yanofskybacteria bacterium RIFCSPLOWO2_02_FULL_45_10]|uniref:GDP-L-fucose synthase n=2 Tax=Candidatus Yanofskyibacteriota TaxID=1752733 RepID=A0A1F8G2K4_9BACT|nr:MAG: GDP-fucose synthetase [Candidatus Yanofskybacteria bacterium RIFCSPHIGHO2_12_FULL_45_19b]OGN32604.1 MAG: GDP-fucose synthetase [Candidatus Yanofskybacteria bacterium RIFCSPLOWO2_02_FULL_45_10]